jgi:anti-anti-sigma factor
MDVPSRKLGDTFVLTPTGRLDHASAEAFSAALAEPVERCAAGRDHIVLDFSALEYISSAGLRVLMVARKQSRARGGRLVIAGLQPIVREIFEISRFDAVFEIFPSVPDALAALSPAALGARDAPSTGAVRVRFWGTRGSIPVAPASDEIERKLVAALVKAASRRIDTVDKARAFVRDELDFDISHTFGGNSSCVQIDPGGRDYLLCDLGSGARVFGNHVLATAGPSGHVFHVFMSHAHWDHIMGFPFFMPAYIPGNVVRIYGGHAELEEAFRRQNAAPCFPVDFARMGARIEFVQLEPGRRYEIAGVTVTGMRQRHGGDSYGYRFSAHGKAIVYSTDSEHRPDDPAETEGFVKFFEEADLVIFDAMYSLAEAVSVKEDWGHSSNVVGVELCQRARVKHLCLFHHEPMLGDEQIAAVLRGTRRLEEITRQEHRLEVSAAWDGMEIVV